MRTFFLKVRIPSILLKSLCLSTWTHLPAKRRDARFIERLTKVQAPFLLTCSWTPSITSFLKKLTTHATHKLSPVTGLAFSPVPNNLTRIENISYWPDLERFVCSKSSSWKDSSLKVRLSTKWCWLSSRSFTKRP